MLYLSRPLQSLARFRPEGDTLTIMSRGCPGVPGCNSTFFLPWLILCWLCWCLKCRFWHWRNLRECVRSYLLSQRSVLMPLKERGATHYRGIHRGCVSLTVNITAHCRLPLRRILVNSATESTFSENEFFLPRCRLLLWEECRLLRKVEFNMRLTCSGGCAYI